MAGVQTSYDAAPAVGYAGQIADASAFEAVPAVVDTNAITAGLVVLKGTADGQARPILSTDEPTGDVDAFVTTASTAASKVSITGASLNGVLGATVFWPPRNVTFTLSSHADFNATVAMVRGLDAFGAPQEETFNIPDAGNVTLTGNCAFSQITSIEIEAQGGTGGSYTIGVGVALGPLDRQVMGVAMYDATREPGTFADEDPVTIVRSGRVLMTSEGTVTRGDPVYVRVVATGGEVRGAVRGTPDASDCGLLRGGHFADSRTGSGLVAVDLDL